MPDDDLQPDRSLRRPPPAGMREVVQRAGRRRRRAVLGGGMLALVVLAAVPVGALALRDDARDTLLADGDSSPSTAPAEPAPADPCPTDVPRDSPSGIPAVPAPPPAGFAGSLVPDQVPTAVTICRYADTSPGSGSASASSEPDGLQGERELLGGLENLPADLAVPAGLETGTCTLIGGGVVPHLLRLSYPTGTLWLSTTSDPNNCSLVSNGEFTSAVYVGQQVSASYEAREWVADPQTEGPSPSACAFARSGRAGQERAFVPTGWATLTVCQGGDGTDMTARPIADDRARDVTDLLNALDSEPGEGGFGASCSDQLKVEGDDDRSRSLHWSYPTGRDVVVVPFIGCDPPLGNGSLSADATAEQQEELLRLLEEG